MMQEAIAMYSEIVSGAIPIAIAFELGNLLVCTFMRAAFGGKLWFGAH